MFTTITYCLISSTASSYFIPASISASATNTGARPNPATQWTAMHEPGSFLNRSCSRSNHLFKISWGGNEPSENSQSCVKHMKFNRSIAIYQITKHLRKQRFLGTSRLQFRRTVHKPEQHLSLHVCVTPKQKNLADINYCKIQQSQIVIILIEI